MRAEVGWVLGWAGGGTGLWCGWGVVGRRSAAGTHCGVQNLVCKACKAGGAALRQSGGGTGEAGNA